MRQFLTTCLTILSLVPLCAQSSANFWNEIGESEIFLPANAETGTMPLKYRTLALDFDGIREFLRTAPAEGSPQARSGAMQIQLPMPDGTMETFKVWESSVMHPKLAAKFPMIKTYAGQGITHPSQTVRLGFGVDGFHAIVRKKDGGAGIIPFASNQSAYYLCSTLDDLVNTENILPIHHVENGDQATNPLAPVESPAGQQIQLRGGGEGAVVERRDYMYALACTGEFASLHGGTVDGVMSAFVTSTSILNTILEPEHAIRLILVADNDQLVFLDAASDPYNQVPFADALFGQNETVLNQTIGPFAYDIGHLFTKNPCNVFVNGVTVPIGGQAGGSFCASNKSHGYSCHANNNIVAFTFSVAAHELAHQLSADHSFSNCPGTYAFAVSSSNAYEPGSGSTIMSYQGACPNNNIPGPAGIYYHGSNMQQIWNYAHTSTGNNCPTKTATDNFSPTVNLPYEDGFYIPISTPFELEADAVDENGDDLTFCWEQYDLGPTSELGQPIGDAPCFRSFDPVSSNLRVFPRLPIILNNGSEITEVLPTYNRNLTFRCTVRDNVAEAGGVTWQDVAFKATASAGPFLVMEPNTSDVIWKAGQEVEVKWDEANTDNALVKCHLVNIKLSTNGGLTFPYTLITDTPNDGSEVVFVPDLVTGQARVRIEASDNIFFDLSNSNFNILQADEPGYTFALNPQSQQICVPDIAALEISTGSVLGFDSLITFEIISGLPVGAGVQFSANPVQSGQSTMLTLDMNDVTADGEFEVQLRAIAGVDTVFRSLFFNVVYNDFSGLALLGPADGQGSLNLLPEFSWTDLPQADAYDFYLSTSPGFEPGTIVDSILNLAEAIYLPDVGLLDSKIYFWKVRPKNECGVSDFSLPFAFQTRITICTPFNSNDVTIDIPNLGTPTIQSTLPILQNGIITDMNVSKLKGTYDILPYLRATLISPASTEVILFSSVCLNVSQFDLGLNDEAAFDIQCPPVNGIEYKPQNPLAAFIGENTLGTWIMKIQVLNSNGGNGVLEKWGLEFCANVTPVSPHIDLNDTLHVPGLQSRRIRNIHLVVTDDDQPDVNEMIFTVVTNTQHGFLSKGGVPLAVGDKFQMGDIYSNNLLYTNTDSAGIVSDFFSFIVEDGTGGWLGTPKFNIIIDPDAPIDATDEADFANQILVAPNPATNVLNVTFEQALDGDARLAVVDVHGRLVLEQSVRQTERTLQISLEGLADGVYFLAVRTAGGVFAKKFVVQH